MKDCTFKITAFCLLTMIGVLGADLPMFHVTVAGKCEVLHVRASSRVDALEKARVHEEWRQTLAVPINYITVWTDKEWTEPIMVKIVKDLAERCAASKVSKDRP